MPFWRSSYQGWKESLPEWKKELLRWKKCCVLTDYSKTSLGPYIREWLLGILTSWYKYLEDLIRSLNR